MSEMKLQQVVFLILENETYLETAFPVFLWKLESVNQLYWCTIASVPSLQRMGAGRCRFGQRSWSLGPGRVEKGFPVCVSFGLLDLRCLCLTKQDGMNVYMEVSTHICKRFERSCNSDYTRTLHILQWVISLVVSCRNRVNVYSCSLVKTC